MHKAISRFQPGRFCIRQRIDAEQAKNELLSYASSTTIYKLNGTKCKTIIYLFTLTLEEVVDTREKQLQSELEDNRGRWRCRVELESSLPHPEQHWRKTHNSQRGTQKAPVNTREKTFIHTHTIYQVKKVDLLQFVQT